MSGGKMQLEALSPEKKAIAWNNNDEVANNTVSMSGSSRKKVPIQSLTLPTLDRGAKAAALDPLKMQQSLFTGGFLPKKTSTQNLWK